MTMVHFVKFQRTKMFTDFLHINGYNYAGNQTGGLGFQNMENRNQQNFNNGTTTSSVAGSDILDSNSHELHLEKSNILLLGPTGSG